MPLSVIGMPNNSIVNIKSSKGFTLLEILIVMVIIGITLTFALMSFGDFGGKRRILLAAESFENYVKLTQQLAILQSSTLGVHVDSSGYQMLKFGLDNQWHRMPENSVFTYRNIPTNAKLNWMISGNSKTNTMIIINASGDMSPFTITFTSNDKNIVNVVGTHDGKLNLNLLGD